MFIYFLAPLHVRQSYTAITLDFYIYELNIQPTIKVIVTLILKGRDLCSMCSAHRTFLLSTCFLK